MSSIDDDNNIGDTETPAYEKLESIKADGYHSVTVYNFQAMTRDGTVTYRWPPDEELNRSEGVTRLIKKVADERYIPIRERYIPIREIATLNAKMRTLDILAIRLECVEQKIELLAIA